MSSRPRLLDRPPFTALGLLWPGGPVIQRPGPAGGDGHPLRVITSNALRENRRLDRWAAAVLALEPDVLCVQELTPRVAAALQRAGVEAVLPHDCVEVRAASAGTGLWSRRPLDATDVIDAGRALVVGRVDDVGVTVAAVHTVAPSRRTKRRQWLLGFEAVRALAERTPGPLIVAGDWNATLAHGPLRLLLGETGLRDAHVDAGRRLARTWPSRFPMALLDRVLVSDEIAVRSIAEHRVPGSDHRAVAANLVIAT